MCLKTVPDDYYTRPKSNMCYGCQVVHACYFAALNTQSRVDQLMSLVTDQINDVLPVSMPMAMTTSVSLIGYRLNSRD